MSIILAPRRYDGLECPLYGLMSVLGHKWALDVLFHLDKPEAPLRFERLKRQITPSITTKELRARLREFEEAGLVVRTVYDEKIPRVEYELSLRGHELKAHMGALLEWWQSLDSS